MLYYVGCFAMLRKSLLSLEGTNRLVLVVSLTPLRWGRVWLVMTNQAPPCPGSLGLPGVPGF